MAKRSNAWVFVSHSNKDLDAVRKVRDELERQNASPILLFLKCIEDHDELDNLIKREIRARHFFLLCGSENAKNSKWVQKEVEFVKSLPNKREDLDLESPWDDQERAIQRLLEQATTFVSYAVADRARVLPYLQALSAEDFAVFDPIEDLRADVDFRDAVQGAIDDAARGGNLVQFLSADSASSPWAVREFEYFIDVAGATMGERRPVVVALDELSDYRMEPFRRHDSRLVPAWGREPEDTRKNMLRALGLE